MIATDPPSRTTDPHAVTRTPADAAHAPAAGDVPADALGPFEIGRVVARSYRILRVLGSGGMGVVYEAEDLALPRRVAIKAPRFAAFAQALRTEAQALASIKHPAFATVLHVAEEDGVDLLVMERLYGETLASTMDDLRAAKTRFSVPEALDLLIAIADGLSAAHRAGVAHRDLKPGNVMVAGERVVLVDLGLFVPEVLVGPDNTPAGSIHYIAPEVVLRDVKPGQGPLVDLYALGAIAFELLTGAPPFVGDSVEQVLAKHVSADVPDPSAVREDVPRDLAALVCELLAKSPGERPSSAEAVLWQLKDVRAHGVAPSARPSVLVVDDDADLGRAVCRTLAQAFPQLVVQATTDPSRGLPSRGRAPADVVVVDLNMPGTNGVEICMALRELPPARRPTIIAMSGSAGEGDVDLLRTLDVDAFVPKDERLLEAVGEARGRARSRAPRATA